jgi:hypothetical protein
MIDTMVVLALADGVELLLRIGAIVVVVVIASLVAWRRRRSTAAPTQPRGAVPAQLDRADFASPDAPWIVVTFTSATCNTCSDVARKAAVLTSREVVVQEVEYARDRPLHDRYRIDAVPTLVIADRSGVVRYGHLGPVSATDLWAAMARCRDPRLRIAQCDQHDERPVHGQHGQ